MKYSPSHEWVMLEGSIGCVGITEHAQKELGEVVYVELPAIGKKVKAGEEIAVLESTKAAADLYSPVSGEVVEINQDLVNTPSKINMSPENEGWLFKIKLDNLPEYDALLDQQHYLKLIS